MPYPTKIGPFFAYRNHEQAQGNGLLPGQQMDVDLAAIRRGVNDLNDFIRYTFRADGRLQNRSVHQEALGEDVLVGFNAPVPWAAGTSYTLGQTIFQENAFYAAAVAHTSGSDFAADYDMGMWDLLVDFTAISNANAAAESARVAAESAQAGAESARVGAVDARTTAEALLSDVQSYIAPSGMTQPANPVEGMLWYDGSLLRVYDGALWVSVATASLGGLVFASGTFGAAPDGEVEITGGFQHALVFLNGLLLAEDDYTVDGDVITITGAQENDEYFVWAYRALDATDYYTKEETDDRIANALAPVTGETIRLSDYLVGEVTHAEALMAAVVALFADAKQPLVLDCEGILLELEEPFIVRTTDVPAMGVTAGFRVIKNLNVIAVGEAWNTHDYMVSICGTAGVADLRFFTLDQPTFRMGGKSLIALHMSGYYHYTVNHPRIREMGPDAVGIYSSRWARTSGLSTLTGPGDGTSTDVGDGVLNSNNGAAILTPDIQGTFGNEDNTVGIVTEDGDFIVDGGWLSWLRKGIVTLRGGLNTNQVHFSMADKATDTIAVEICAPRGCSLFGDELDGCTYAVHNPEANSWTPGASYTGWNQLSFEGFKFSSVKAAVTGTLGGGIVTLRTMTDNELIRGLRVIPDWATQTGDFANTKKLLRFRTHTTGSWDAAGFAGPITVLDPDNFGVGAPEIPSGAYGAIVQGEAGAGKAGVAWSGAFNALALFGETTSQRMGLRLNGNVLEVISLTTGAPVNLRIDGPHVRIGGASNDGSLTIAGPGTDPLIIPCEGTPEGQITANRGSLALRTNGGVGSTLYYKSSGTGNTGWTAVA